MKILTIKNGHLATIKKALTYDMPFAQKRLKNRFFTLIAPNVAEVEKSRLELCEALADKDSEGKPKTEDKQYIFPKDSKFPEEYGTLLSEDCAIEFPTLMVSDIGGIKHLLELSTVPLKDIEYTQVEHILLAFDNLTSEPTPKEPDSSIPEALGV